ncbi:MAG: glycoside hydrolase [Ruminococcus sp.]|nr:glycoside hydrolase [Ruminococcus sp.]
MDLKQIIALTSAAVIAAAGVAGCSKNGGNSESNPDSIAEDATAATTRSHKLPAEGEKVDTYPDYPISYPEIEEKDTGDRYEAEDAKLTDGLRVDGTKEEPATNEDGEVALEEEEAAEDEETTTQPATEKVDPLSKFSGKGYVTGFKPDGSSYVTFEVNAPSNQHYDLSFSIASQRLVNCRVAVNGVEASTFKTMDDGEFTLITLYGVFLTKGKSEIELRPEDGNICLDYLRVVNNTSLSKISYDAGEELTNENAGDSAKQLMSFLTDNYGKYVLTGQYASSPDNEEIELIYRTTGKYPAIRFSAMHNSGNSFDDTFMDIDACADWYRNGGIVGLMWYWESPDAKKPSVYAEETDFKLSDAVTDQNIATMSQEEIRELYAKKKISEQCYGLILDIDNMAGQLLTLKKKGIPVLWRPLHEGYGDWFWWGASGTDAYKWLWQLMYTRMTEYFELDNLIWIWNGQSDTTLVDQATFDIASIDIYMKPDKDFGSRYEQFLAMQNMVGKNKLIALSECSSVPDIDASFRDNAVWSFFGLWYGKYLRNDKGELSEEFTTKDALIRAYNSDGALTLDEYIKLRGGEPLSTGTTSASTTASTTTTASADTTETTAADTDTDTSETEQDGSNNQENTETTAAE